MSMKIKVDTGADIGGGGKEVVGVTGPEDLGTGHGKPDAKMMLV